jgi:Ca2+-dependent lipid-binding protein
LQSFVAEQVHATLGPMMYAPNVFTVDVAGMMAGGTDLEAANGVLAVTIYSASGIKSGDIFGSIDPYITFHTGNTKNKELARTSAVENSTSPRWNETHFILLNNLKETLCLQLMDRNVGRKDASLGTVNLELKELEENDNLLEGLNLIALKNGKAIGEIKADVRYYPTAKPTTLEDGTVQPAAASNSGILRFTVHECSELSGGKSGGIGVPLLGGGSVSAYAKLNVNGKEALRTKTFKRSSNPRWDKYVEVFVADKTKVNLNIDVMESKEFADDSVIATWKSTLTAVEKQLVEDKSEWWSLNDGRGKIHVSAIWKPVVMTGLGEGMSHVSYSPPIGVVRLHFFGATNLKNVEALTAGKSDPYVRVKSGLHNRGQTEFIDDNLDPDWNEVVYVPIHSIREDLVLEVMDFNENTKDKLLGLTDLSIKSIVKEVEGTNGQKIYESLPAVDK